jgi:hypothetical protein
MNGSAIDQHPPATDLSGRARTARLVATALGLVLLLAGTVAGTDDDFPFGPFRMFATTDHWNAPITVARAEVVDAAGHVTELTEDNSGIRRAELEGQLDRFRADPARLAGLAAAYRAHNPSASPPAEVRVLLRHHELRRRGPTGRYTDEMVATWRLG